MSTDDDLSTVAHQLFGRPPEPIKDAPTNVVPTEGGNPQPSPSDHDTATHFLRRLMGGRGASGYIVQPGEEL